MLKIDPSDISELVQDSDGLALKIFSMYQNKNYLPHNERVSNIAWRIHNQKFVRRAKSPAEGAAPKQKVAKPAHTLQVSSSVDDFDYVAHIRKISQEEYGGTHMTKSATMLLVPMSNPMSSGTSQNIFSSSSLNSKIPSQESFDFQPNPPLNFQSVKPLNFLPEPSLSSQAPNSGQSQPGAHATQPQDFVPNSAQTQGSVKRHSRRPRSFSRNSSANTSRSSTSVMQAPPVDPYLVHFSSESERLAQTSSPGRDSSKTSLRSEGSFLSSYISLLESTLKGEPHSPSAGSHRLLVPGSSMHYGLLHGSKSSGLECSNCHTRTTPLWRNTAHGDTLCNACGLFYKLHGTLRPAANTQSQSQSQSQRGKPSRTIHPSSAPTYRSPPDSTVSSSNLGLFEKMGKSGDRGLAPQAMHRSPLAPDLAPSLVQASGEFGTFVDFDRTATQQGPFGQFSYSQADSASDEIDKLLNMNLFQLESFVIGASKGPDLHSGTYNSKGLEAMDEILIDEPHNHSTNWNWLDFEPTSTGH